MQGKALIRALPVIRDDAALTAALRARQPGMPALLVDRNSHYVERLMVRVVGVDEELPDLVQDVFLQATTSLWALRDPNTIKLPEETAEPAALPGESPDEHAAIEKPTASTERPTGGVALMSKIFLTSIPFVARCAQASRANAAQGRPSVRRFPLLFLRTEGRFGWCVTSTLCVEKPKASTRCMNWRALTNKAEKGGRIKSNAGARVTGQDLEKISDLFLLSCVTPLRMPRLCAANKE